MSKDSVRLRIRYSYFYPEPGYLQSISSGATTDAYKGFKEFEVVESYANDFTTVASLTSFVTKVAGIPAASQKIAKDGVKKLLDLSKPRQPLSSIGLASGDTVVVQTMTFPGPYNYGRLSAREKAALRKSYPPPANLRDFSNLAERLHWAKWESNTADTNMYTGAANLAADPNSYAAYPFTQQYYNPANPKTPTGPVSVTKIISWNGLPGLLRNVRPYRRLYELADKTSRIGERVNQTEYCEWKAFYVGKDRKKIAKIVLTCEGPEYWQQLFAVNPHRCVELYRKLTGIPSIVADDLIAKRDIKIQGQVLVRKGDYNFWNKFNTSAGIVHLNQHNNFLSAELNIAVLSTQLQQEKDNQGNLEILEKALPLVLSGQYGSPGRNSDPTIGFVCNWIARHPLGLRLTIEPPVALYFGLLNTTGWRVPDGTGTIDDWVKCTRGKAKVGQALRYEICPPDGVDGYVNDITIAGEPLRYGGQAARCMTVQLTGRAAAFSPGVAPPVRPRPFIESSFQTTDPVSGEPVGHILERRPAAAKAMNYGLVAAKSRVPLAKVAKTPRSLVLNSNPPEYSPAEAHQKAIETERAIVLDVDDIQGDPLVGFNTSHSIILLFDIDDVAATKKWLKKTILPALSTTRDVLGRHAHMRLHREALAKGSTEGPYTSAPDYTYLNISFSSEGLELLTNKRDVKQFYAVGNSEAFSHGLPKRSTLLGDPEVGTGEKGARDLWLFGGDRTPHIMVQVQADTGEACERLAADVKAGYGKGGHLVFADVGKRRPGAEAKPKEQFGFHDGVSNPDVRGMYKQALGAGDSGSGLAYLARRDIDKSDPRWNTYSKPGTYLVWPGEIILGQPKQRNLDGAFPPQHYLLPGETEFQGPAWAKNGTFVVYRRLRQDVAAFWNHAQQGADAMNEQFKKQEAPAKWDATKMASRFIGRWPSGCPIMLSPDADVEAWGYNKMTQNAFNYATDTPPFPSAKTSEPVEGAPTIPQDNIGLRCPMGSHVRKVNPRDQGTDFGPDEDTLTHRFIRRGTPYGDFVKERNKFKDDGKDRGLQFIAYMASIDMQFEFVIRFWANVNQQPVPMTEGRSDDMVIGQTAAAGYRRKLTALDLNRKGLPAVATTPATSNRWVTATGGGYFFMPSVTALKDVIGAR